MPKTITYWFRCPVLGAFSIEQVFAALTQGMSQRHKVQRQTLPNTSSGLLNVLRNLWFAFCRSAGSDVHHITGDVHYLALALRKGRIVLTIHDCNLLVRTSRLNPKYHAYLWLWYKWPIQRAAVITTISEQSKAEIVAFTGCSPEKIQVIPNAVDPVYQPTPTRFSPDCPRILHIGVTPNKNLQRIIPALEGIPCTFVIIGRLNEEHTALLQRHSIQYENFFALSLEEMAAQYRQADLVLFASTYEGFGMPIAEAQASGRPVVTSSLAPMNWVAGDGGACLVDPFQPDSIRTGVLRALQDSSFSAQIVEKGLQNVRRFDATTIFGMYEEKYHARLKKHPRIIHPEYHET